MAKVELMADVEQRVVAVRSLYQLPQILQRAAVDDDLGDSIQTIVA